MWSFVLNSGIRLLRFYDLDLYEESGLNRMIIFL
jgi:hypothetical protein